MRPPERVDYDLTPHETRLLKLFVEGYNYVAAAEKLGISCNTLDFHVRNIYDKLQIHSKSEAVASPCATGSIKRAGGRRNCLMPPAD